MKVYTFGCSYTYGYKDYDYNVTSWVEQLAKQFPEVEFEDYSFPGTCIEYSLFLLDNVIKQKRPEDKIVFQFTPPYRYTTWTNSDIFYDGNNRYKKISNYSKYKPEITDHLERYVCNDWLLHENDPTFSNLDKRFFKLYYTKINQNKELSTYYAITEYVKQHADYAFFQKDYYYHNNFKTVTTVRHYDFSPCVQVDLDSKLYNSYTWDVAQHFNEDGCKYVANNVAKNLELINTDRMEESQ
jgi:hypothetical protein